MGRNGYWLVKSQFVIFMHMNHFLRYLWSALVVVLWGIEVILTRIVTAIVNKLPSCGIVAIQVKFAWRTIAFTLARWLPWAFSRMYPPIQNV
jgi:hypothetical protein